MVLLGLIPLIWFGALHQALYDSWAMTLAFAWITVLATLLIAMAYKKKQPLKFPLLTSWTLLVIAGWLSVMHSFDVTTSLWEAWGWTFCMIVFYLVVNGFAAAPALQRFFLIAAGSVVLPLTFAALHQQLYGSPTTYGAVVVHGHVLWHYGRWEIHATLVNSVVFAGFLLAWGCVFWPFAPGRSRLKGILFLTLACGILLSRSWTACLCLVAGLVFYRHLLYGKSLDRSFFAKALLFGGGACLFMMFWKLHQPSEGQHYVSSMRFLYWKAAVRMFLAYPLTGIGLGGYATAFPYFKHAAGENTLLAHGLFWQILGETGVCGLLACGVCAVEFWGNAKDALQKKAWSSEELGLCVTLAMLLVFGMTTIYFDYLLNKLTFVIFAGFLCARMPTRAHMLLRPSAAILTIALLITCSSLWLSLFRAEQCYAAGSYSNALRLNPRLADAWAKLADAQKDPAQGRRMRMTAWHWKKDRNFLIANLKRTTR